MRKIVVFNRVTVDGFFAGNQGEIDWHVIDPQIDETLRTMMSPDTYLFGRVTYQLFESFWPTAAKDPTMPDGFRKIADELNRTTKVVFSKTVTEANWENTRLVAANPVDEARRLKHETSGGDIVIFGSGSIVTQLAQARLIDRYLNVITPVVLGSGKSMFATVDRQTLLLVETVSFASGHVLIHYAADTVN